MQKVFKALQLKELKNKSYYGSPNIFDYSIDIFVPLSIRAEKEVVFYTRLPVESIQAEIGALFRIAAAMVLLLLVVEVIFGFVMYRAIVVPLKTLAAGSFKVATGDLTVQLPLTKRKDEINLVFDKCVLWMIDKRTEGNLGIRGDGTFKLFSPSEVTSAIEALDPEIKAILSGDFEEAI